VTASAQANTASGPEAASVKRLTSGHYFKASRATVGKDEQHGLKFWHLPGFA
jgi:hypothetical protein